MAMTAREQFQGWHLAVSTILMIAGLLGLDRLVAVYFHESGHQGAWLFVQGTILFDTVTGKDISKFLLGLVLIAAALVMLAVPRSRRLGWSTLFVGSVQLLGTLVTGVAKNFFDRLRPFQVLERGDWSHVWFVDGTAFPSGHAGYYFGLFLPLAWLFPRWRWTDGRPHLLRRIISVMSHPPQNANGPAATSPSRASPFACEAGPRRPDSQFFSVPVMCQMSVTMSSGMYHMGYGVRF